MNTLYKVSKRRSIRVEATKSLLSLAGSMALGGFLFHAFFRAALGKPLGATMDYYFTYIGASVAVGLGIYARNTRGCGSCDSPGSTAAVFIIPIIGMFWLPVVVIKRVWAFAAAWMF